jgi:methyl-accepting chemotaxis protein
MFFQLGNIVFSGRYSPTSISIDGGEATYAERELIDRVTQIDKSGRNASELTIDIKLHAKYGNPTQQLADIKKATDSGAVLPFLWGTGKLLGNFVIVKYPYTIDEAFADGTIIRATLNLTIREYITYNELEKKQLEAKASAFAVGVKNPVPQRPPQPPTPVKEIALTVTATKMKVSKINQLVSDFKHNTASAQEIGKKIQDTSKRVNENVNTFKQQLDNARAVENEFTEMRSAAENVAASAKAITDLYPYTSLDSLEQLNTLLQGTTNTFGGTTNGLMQGVILRKPITE